MPNVSIEQLETAINIWRTRLPSSEEKPLLCKPARELADAYGLMIIKRQWEIDRDCLSATQREAFDGAFSTPVL